LKIFFPVKGRALFNQLPGGHTTKYCGSLIQSTKLISRMIILWLLGLKSVEHQEAAEIDMLLDAHAPSMGVLPDLSPLSNIARGRAWRK